MRAGPRQQLARAPRQWPSGPRAISHPPPGDHHPQKGRPDSFRPANSVHRKTWDLATRHPDYTGKPTRGNHLDAEVLRRFLASEDDMELRARSVRGRLSTATPSSLSAPVTPTPSSPAPTRNVWTVEEMILAADVADDLSRGRVNAAKPEVIALSKLLRSAEIHVGHPPIQSSDRQAASA